MDRHLLGCTGCRQELEQERNLFLALADPLLHAEVLAVPPPLPSDFADRIMARVRAERRGPGSLWDRLVGYWAGLRWSSVAYGLSACLVFSAGTSQFLRSLLSNAVYARINPVLDRAAGLWADAVVWLVQHQVAVKQVLYSLGN